MLFQQLQYWKARIVREISLQQLKLQQDYKKPYNLKKKKKATTDLEDFSMPLVTCSQLRANPPTNSQEAEIQLSLSEINPSISMDARSQIPLKWLSTDKTQMPVTGTSQDNSEPQVLRMSQKTHQGQKPGIEEDICFCHVHGCD